MPSLNIKYSKTRLKVSTVFFSIVIGWTLSSFAPDICLASSPNTHPSRNLIKGELLKTTVEIVHPAPEHWETQHQNMFQNRGLAQIEMVAKEYMLTVFCDGIHRVFIHPNKDVNLENYVGKFVKARYTYGDVRKHVQCIKAPCTPITERKVIIHGIEEIIASAMTRAQFENQCDP